MGVSDGQSTDLLHDGSEVLFPLVSSTTAAIMKAISAIETASVVHRASLMFLVDIISIEVQKKTEVSAYC
jgi:hypothetical protein